VQVANPMRHWQQDSDLIGIRDEEKLLKLATQEREACQKLWDEVGALLRKAS